MTARTQLDPGAANRLRKLCGMLGSQHDGERATAAAKADAFVRSLGLSWHDVIGPPIVPEHSPRIRSWRSADTDWQRMAQFCHARRWSLSQRERELVESALKWRQQSEKQKDWLTAIFARGCTNAGAADERNSPAFRLCSAYRILCVLRHLRSAAVHLPSILPRLPRC
jgi:hypothetical protein